ncbi:MAG TPA: D-TA family PLP-dependent enzyme [Pedobacter sp.]|nr:D-TA family PLP-dependent enzyme [Pedobacter sp.]
MLLNEKAWYEINNVDQLDSPALVIYADRVKKNIQTLINNVSHIDQLRPHVKTHKCIEATELMILAGINKFKCATIAEAEMLAMSKSKDVLLAYQPNRPKMKRFIKLIEKYPTTKFSCLVDHIAIAEQLADAAQKNGITISVYLDLNVGMNRTGIAPENAFQLCKKIAELPSLSFMGLHAYDGHIDETDFVKRTHECMEIYNRVLGLKEMLVANGFEKVELIMGGSPSFPIYAQLKDVECSPGTFVYWDGNYQNSLPEQNFLPAALVVGRIISMPSPELLTVDIGHKSISSEYELSRRVRFLNAPDLHAVSHSEEHLVLKAPENHSYQMGDVLYALPSHICPTCALYEHAVSIKDRELDKIWKIVARDRKIGV